jgi:predicted O-methyltransferase YrrM
MIRQAGRVPGCRMEFLAPQTEDWNTTMFERLTWQGDRILLNDLVFYLNQDKCDQTNGFLLDKPVRLLRQYMALWQRRPAMRVKNVLELGIYGGGSIAFWFELLQPDKYVALDFAAWGNTEFFNRYIASHQLASRIKTVWKTNQSDRAALRAIVAAEFDGPLDLIIDDASHLYSETKASFETLFPRLRPGGLYIIEDWSWGCWPNLPATFLPAGTELPKLIHRLVDAAGSMQRFLSSESGNSQLKTINPLIESVTTYGDIVVIERGGAEMTEEAGFNLDDHITFRPDGSLLERCWSRIRYAAINQAKSTFGIDTRNRKG